MHCNENHIRCKGLWWLVVGLLIILNSVYAVVSWGLFVGILVLVWGFLKLVAPECYGHGHICRNKVNKAPARKKSRRKR